MKIKSLIREPEDFLVHELVDKKAVKRFSRTAKGVSEAGKYTLYLMKKRNMTTHDAIKKVASELNITADSIGYAGLKDKHAITTQYITLQKDIQWLKDGELELFRVGKTDRKISIGDLLGNYFVITLHDWNKDVDDAVKKIEKNGFPNYFGEQRFGAHGDNHIVGKLIVKRKFSEALGMINRDKRKFSNIRAVDKRKLKFFVNAYQSWIFNQTAKRLLKKGKAGKIPIVGYDTKLGKSQADKMTADILREEKTRGKDFRIGELRLACRGSSREMLVRTEVKYTKNGDFRLYFVLPKGSYATVLLEFILAAS